MIKGLKDFLIMLYEDLTKKIIGCAMEVHKRLGNGFQEVIYQKALKIEMHIAGLDFTREMEMPIFLKGCRNWNQES